MFERRFQFLSKITSLGSFSFCNSPWVGITIPQNLHLCPMFSKVNKKLGNWVLRQILFTSWAALQQQCWVRTKRNVIVSAKSKQKRHSRPTKCTKTLGISEDFDVLLSRTVYSSMSDISKNILVTELSM